MKKLITLTKSHFKSFIRNRGAIFGVILFPIIFIGIFGIAFQASDPLNSTYELGIVNNDVGIPNNANVPFLGGIATNLDVSEYYIDTLGSLTYPDNQTNLFDINIVGSEEEGLELLEKREIYGLIVIGKDFSLFMMDVLKQSFEQDNTFQSLTNNWENYPVDAINLEIDIIGDQTLQAFSIISNILKEVSIEFFNVNQLDDLSISVNVKGNIDSEGLTAFDFVFPGLVVFGILQTLALIAQTAYVDVDSKMVLRLRNSKMKGSEYVLSLILNQLIISLIQIPVFFLVATMFGFELTIAIGYAFLIGLIFSLSISGIGLITAAVSKSDSMVGVMANMIGTPIAFLSGAFFLVPNPTIIGEGGFLGENSLRLYDLLSATPGLRMLRGVLLTDKTIMDYQFDFFLLIATTVIYLVVGIYLYSRNHLRPEK